MKERLLLLFAFVLLIVVLAGLNAASYVQRVKEPDKEFQPNRSTYHTGETGTRAFYTLLAETGQTVMRWQRPTSDLSTETRQLPQTFIIIGPLNRAYTPAEYQSLLEWVSAGGRLVVIDRDPPSELQVTTSEWTLSLSSGSSVDIVAVDPANQPQMIDKTAAVRPSIPSLFTDGVVAVQPSRFASSIRIERFADVDLTPWLERKPEEESTTEEITEDNPPPEVADASESNSNTPEEPYDFYSGEPLVPNGSQPPPPPADAPSTEPDIEQSESLVLDVFNAPVVHFASGDRTLLLEVPYGSGQIVFLTDPFIVANGGISAVDNAQLAMNIAASGGGTIAFDEYHHGYGAENNRVLEYFQGTPVTSMFLQMAAIAAFLLYSRSRRFARPVPIPEPDRLSKLEYVSAMAELQKRTKAFDLAMENIYADFRRRVARHLGVDNTHATRRELALKIAERTKMDPVETEELMSKCEDISHGESTNKGEMLRLVAGLRDIEDLLRLKRAGKARI